MNNIKHRLSVLSLVAIPFAFRAAVYAHVVNELVKLGFKANTNYSAKADWELIYVNYHYASKKQDSLLEVGLIEHSARACIRIRLDSHPASGSALYTAEQYDLFLASAKQIALAFKVVEVEIKGTHVTITKDEVTIDATAVMAQVTKLAKEIQAKEFGS
jgi:hypothetical protein